MNGPPCIGVVGAGLMGHGIAQVFAVAGHPVRVYDPAEAILDGLRDRIRSNLRELGQDEAPAGRVEPCDDLADAVRGAAFVVEAAIEDLALKRDLFRRIEADAPSDAILASNTSVIPITAIAEGMQRPGRAIGTHWWNPPYLVPLVEVVPAKLTDANVVINTIALLESVGKTAVLVRKDVPGFVGNRLQHALWREAVALVQDGVCDAETVDTVVKASFGRRLAVLGPLENADLIGTDLTLAIHRTLLPHLDRTPGPLPLLTSLVAEGRLGMKAGAGFREWTADGEARLRGGLVQHLKAARDQDAARNTEGGNNDAKQEVRRQP